MFPAIAVLVLAAGCSYGGWQYVGGWFKDSPRVVRSAVHDMQKSPEFQIICYIHYRAYESDKLTEPRNFFDMLGIDTSTEPFLDRNWLDVHSQYHMDAKAVILKQWAETKETLVRQGGSKEEQRCVDQAGATLIQRETAKVYWDMFMPKIWLARGDARLEALKELCDKQWKDPGFRKHHT